MPAASQTPAFVIEKLTVRADRVVCRVRVNPGAPRMTTPALAAKIARAFPTLPLHSCVNEQGDTFAAVLNCTSLPHVLEHMVIDEQVRAAERVEHAQRASRVESPSPEGVFTGVTRWLDESAGVAEIQVSYADDLVALRSFQAAVRALNQLVLR